MKLLLSVSAVMRLIALTSRNGIKKINVLSDSTTHNNVLYVQQQQRQHAFLQRTHTHIHNNPPYTHSHSREHILICPIPMQLISEVRICLSVFMYGCIGFFVHTGSSCGFVGAYNIHYWVQQLCLCVYVCVL